MWDELVFVHVVDIFNGVETRGWWARRKTPGKALREVEECAQAVHHVGQQIGCGINSSHLW